MTTETPTRFRPRATIVMVVVAVGLWLAAQLGWIPQDLLASDGAKPDVGTAAAQASDYPVAAAPLTLLENDGFTVGYDNRRHYALWVRYVARRLPSGSLPARPDFAADPRIADARSPRELPRGYDRGHLAPNYLITKLYGAEAQTQSFYMSNIAPQRPRMNQLLWQRLEEIEADQVAARAGRLEVTLGPVFGRSDELPESYYRLWYQPDANPPQVLAFLVPQTVRGDEALTDFLTSVDDIERLTGLDFYAGLADDVEQRMESSVPAPELWQFARHACDPARYHEDWQGRDGVQLRYDRC